MNVGELLFVGIIFATIIAYWHEYFRPFSLYFMEALKFKLNKIKEKFLKWHSR